MGMLTYLNDKDADVRVFRQAAGNRQACETSTANDAVE